MSRVSTWLHLPRTTEAAFTFYKSIFGGEFVDGIKRFGDMPAQEGVPALPEEEKNLVSYVTLPIMGGHLLIGNDVPSFLGESVFGNAVDIVLDPETRAEADRLFAALSEGGKVDYAPGEMGGNYIGSCVDKFGITWMINCTAK